MKIILETEKCIGCGTCVALCDKVFALGEDNKAYVKPKPEEMNAEDEKCAQDAADACPVQCIHIENKK